MQKPPCFCRRRGGTASRNQELNWFEPGWSNGPRWQRFPGSCSYAPACSGTPSMHQACTSLHQEERQEKERGGLDWWMIKMGLGIHNSSWLHHVLPSSGASTYTLTALDKVEVDAKTDLGAYLNYISLAACRRKSRRKGERANLRLTALSFWVPGSSLHNLLLWLMHIASS